MKLILVVSLCAVCETASADWRMIGRPRYGLPQLPPPVQPQAPPAPPRPQVFQPAPRIVETQAPSYWEGWRGRFAHVCKDPYRISGGRTYDLSPLFLWLKNNSASKQPLDEWEFIRGKVLQVLGDGLLIDCYDREGRERSSRTIFVTNEPNADWIVDDETFVTVARSNGRHQYNSVLGARKTVESYDHGTLVVGEELERLRWLERERTAQEARDQEQKKEQELLAEQQVRDQQNFERLKTIEAKAAKAVEFQKQRAAAGSPTAQFDLGCRYLDGVGVPQDVELARQWLAKSAAQGNAQAKAKLTALSLSRP
jgi:Sel1 repeat-containing protein